MINFSRKTNIFASLQASPEEWDGIKSIMKLAANPDIYKNSDLERVSGRTLPFSEIEVLSKRLQNIECTPVVLGKSDVQTLLAVCQNIRDSRMAASSLDDEIVSNIERQMQQITGHGIFVIPSMS